MSNIPSNQPSIRVHAPPGGHSNNIFGTSEFEQSAANKKKHMESDIFGSKKETNEPTPSTKPSRNTGNNIFGTDSEQPNTKSGTIAGQFKQTQMKSNIFGNDEPTTSRPISDKNKSNIFGNDEPATSRPISDKNKSNIFGNDEPATSRPVSDKNKSDIFGVNDKNKHASGIRQGLRVGYNPINGEAYTPKENINTNEKESESKPTENENGNTHTESNDNAQVASTEKTQISTEKVDVKKAADPINENPAQKNVHTSVRVFHPPGGKSNGPLW